MESFSVCARLCILITVFLLMVASLIAAFRRESRGLYVRNPQWPVALLCSCRIADNGIIDGHTSYRFFNPRHTAAMGIVQPEPTLAGQAAKIRVVTGANIMAINQLRIAAKAVSNSSRTGIFNLTDLYTINSEI